VEARHSCGAAAGPSSIGSICGKHVMLLLLLLLLLVMMV
jgi:hypothetical protein